MQENCISETSVKNRSLLLLPLTCFFSFHLLFTFFRLLNRPLPGGTGSGIRTFLFSLLLLQEREKVFTYSCEEKLLNYGYLC